MRNTKVNVEGLIYSSPGEAEIEANLESRMSKISLINIHSHVFLKRRNTKSCKSLCFQIVYNALKVEKVMSWKRYMRKKLTVKDHRY